jgi:hypothetical protein
MLIRKESSRAASAATTTELISGANASSPRASRYVTAVFACRMASTGADAAVPALTTAASMAETRAGNHAPRLVKRDTRITPGVYDGAEATAPRVESGVGE